MEYFIKVYIKSEDDLPKHNSDVIYFRPYYGIFEGKYIDARKEDWLQNIKWYLKPVELPEITDDTFSEQSTPDLCCGVYDEPPLELRICTRCGKEFKSNINNPICPSCYFVKMEKIEYFKIYTIALEDCINDMPNQISTSYDEADGLLTIRKNNDVVYSARYYPKDYDSKAKLLHAFIKECVKKYLNL